VSDKSRSARVLLASGCLLLLAAILLYAGRSMPSRALTEAGLVVATLAIVAAGTSVVAGVYVPLWRELHPTVIATPRNLVAEASRLATVAGIDRAPQLRVVKDKRPVAHVRSWRGPERITVHTGLLDQAGPLAVTGVLGHETGHIINGDTRDYRRVFLPVIVASCSALIAVFTLNIAGALGPAAWLRAEMIVVVLMGIVWVAYLAPASRRCERAADRAGVHLTGVEAQLAALDLIPTKARGHLKASVRALRCFNNYPTVEQRRAAVHAAGREMAGRR
jgi:Zn-dependent protease with chaperone function